MRALGVFVVVCLSVKLAHADDVAEKVKAGEELAKQSRWTEAIESFKAADKIERRAKHACLIALAYIRRELWPQAEVFLNLCHQRANANDPVPDWVQLAETQLRERLANQKVAPVNIRIVPEDLAKHAMFSVSSWAPDELFSPTTIHLPRGKHLITATVEGRPAIEQQIDIADNTPREIVLDFDHRSDRPSSHPPPEPRGPQTSKLVPNLITGLGGAALIGGVAYHLLAFKKTRDDLAAASSAGDTARYDELSKTFDGRRRNTILLYSAGSVLVATGLVLRFTVFHDERPMVALGLTPGGAVATVEWHR